MMLSNTLRCHLLSFLLLYLPTCVIVPLICNFLPYSKLYTWFHDKSYMRTEVDKLNSERLQKAEKYFHSINGEQSRLFYSQSLKSGIDIAVVIVTVNRQPTNRQRNGYLMQVAASLDRTIKNDEYFASKYLYLCNVDRIPDKHNDAIYLKKFIPQVQRFSGTHASGAFSTRGSLYSRILHKNDHEKETVDYMFCLESAIGLRPRYVLMVEDDTIPCLSMFEILKSKLTNPRLGFILANQSFSYIKLYYPEKWQGFSRELDRVLELFCYGVLQAGLFLLLQTMFQRIVCGSKIRKGNQTLYFMVYLVYFLCITYILGRQTMLDLRRFHPSLYYLRKSPGCCTPAMLYPYNIVQNLLEFLGKEEMLSSFPTDLAIHEFVKRNNYSAFQIEPNIFRHIGMYTSLSNHQNKDPRDFLFSVC